MDDEREEFLGKLMEIISDAVDQMTPIQRAFCDIRCDQIMEDSHNGFRICYCLRDPGKRLLTKDELQERGREEEVKILWLLEHGPFSFKGYGAGCEDRTHA